MTPLRKLTFTKKEQSDRGGFDYVPNTEGYFHEWGNSSDIGDNGEVIQDVVGVVEEVSTGKVFKVDPTAIRFTDKPEH